MSQTVSYWVNDTERRRELPDANEPVVPGICWGDHWNLFTPAYWVSQLWMSDLDGKAHSPYRAQGSLAEELVFCLLGGYGITAELAMAAFKACRDADLIANLNASTENWVEVLRRPLEVGGRNIHYRYPNQKAIYLADAMKCVRNKQIDPQGGRALRDSLLRVRGVGPKTAGWVARNYLDADDVAILDIHIVRAGVLCDLFTPEQKVERQYFEMEAQYINLCHAMNVRPAVLDCLIWDQMRTVGRLALDAIKHKFGQDDPVSSNVPRPQQMPLPLAH